MKYRDHVGKVKCDMLEFPMKHLSVNIYKYDPKYKALLLRISGNQSRDKVVDVLLREDKGGNAHYTWLKNMSHITHGGIGHKSCQQRFVCKCCLSMFKTDVKLEKHKVICTDKGFMQRYVFPTEESKILQFKNYKNKWLIPFIIYADMECKLVESSEENVISKHTPISIAYSVVSKDPEWQRECWIYTGDDCIQQFLVSLDQLKLELVDVMHLQLPIKILSRDQQEHHSNATNGKYAKNSSMNMKKDHENMPINVITQASIVERKLNNLSLTGIELLILFHKRGGYDMYHIIKKVEDRKADVSGTSKEKVLTAKVHLLKEDDGVESIGKKYDLTKVNYQFKDSFAFMNSSLATV